MAGSDPFSPTARAEISALKEALRAQHQATQNVYFELEKEREASATAASEALSMIFRLQEEKAAEKMEGQQYRRMAEEVIHHAEDSLVALEDLVFQKEMEISSLRCQVQAYKHKLLGGGFSDLDIGEKELPRSSCFWRKDANLDKMRTRLGSTRSASPPALLSKGLNLINSCVERGTSIPSRQGTNEVEDYQIVVEHEIGLAVQPVRRDGCEDSSDTHEEMQNISEECMIEDCNSYWKQIEQKDKRMKELSHNKSTDERLKSEWILANKDLQATIAAYSASLRAGSQFCSCHSVSSGDQLHESTRRETDIKLDCGDSENSILDVHSGKCIDSETIANVHDIFEISQNQVAQNPMMEGENWIEKPYSAPTGTAECYHKEEVEQVKKPLIKAHQENKFSTQWNAVANNCQWPPMNPKISIGPSQSEVEQLNRRLQLLENERCIMKQETLERRKEEMKLLGEIFEQIKAIQTHIERQGAEKCYRQNDSSLANFIEAMLSISM